MTTRKEWMYAAGFMLLVAAAALVAGCNSATDDPNQSSAIVTVSSVSPSEACVDYDGTPQDTDGDGTPDTTVYESVENTVNFESRLRNSDSGAFRDVIFSRVDILYEMTAGPQPPNRLGEQITVSVPAGGTASLGLTTVLANDVAAGFFDGTSRGSIRMVFHGQDVAGEPQRTEGSVPIRSVTVCN